MAIKIKPAGKLLLIGVIVAAAIIGYYFYQKAPKAVDKAHEISKTETAIPDAPEASLSGAANKIPFPSTQVSDKDGVRIVWNEMAWNSQTGLNYANGGAVTTKGSLIEQAGLRIQIVRQDDCAKSVADMVKHIQDYKSGNTKDGFFITFMGSGIPSYLTSIANATKELGPEYRPVAFLTFGKSYGEDQVIGDISIKQNPKLLKGKVARGVRMDGDHDLLIKYASDNGIPVNANDKIYDPEAVNLSYSKDFLSAVVDYNNNATEVRKLVRNGKTAGDTTVGYDIVTTWTPGDVNAVNGRGGVTLVSTRTYASIMPNITIACRKFLNDNRDAVEKLIVALGTAGDQVRSFDDVKKYATNLNAKIWDEQNGEYWYKYYNGVKKDNNTFLGGSMVYNLADMSRQFGLNGTVDIYKEVYNTFGKLQSKLYPEDLPAFVPYTEAVDKSFMQSAIANHSSEGGKALEVEYNNEITEQVSSKDVQINFETNSAVINATSKAVLDNIYSSAVTGEGLKLGIYGHTDNAGTTEQNQFLSEKRAQSVRNYLIKLGLPAERIEAKGYGETDPVADNTTEAGKAKNRRVQIVLGK